MKVNLNDNNLAESSKLETNASTVDKLEQEISHIEKYILQCIQDLKYGEAEIAKIRIVKLKAALVNKKKRELESQHNMEIESLENQSNTEIIEYDKEWENRLIEFSEEVKKMEHEINNKHSDDINEIKQLFEEKHNKKKVKFSKNYFELKSQQMNLVKQQFFKEAEVVLKKLDILEKKEIENFNNDLNDKLKVKLENLMKRHEIEKLAFHKKVNAETEELKKQRETKREQILNKYRNKRFDLTLQQKREDIMNENEKVSRKKHSALNSTRYFTPINSSIKFLSPESKIRKLHRIKSKNSQTNTGDDFFNF